VLAAFTPQPQGVTTLWLVLITPTHEGMARLSWLRGQYAHPGRRQRGQRERAQSGRTRSAEPIRYP